MNIGSAAERSGVPPKTIRYYESIGLIAPADRRANNYRDYSESDVQTLRFIHRARSLGFSVRGVAGLLALWRDRRRTSHDVKALALARPKNRAFCTTIRAIASAAWVNLYREQISPAAKIRGLAVCSRSFTLTPFLSYSTPAASNPKPSTLGVRPTPTKISSTVMS